MQITQEQLASMINISPRQMAYIETGKRGLTLENAVAVADCLSLTLDYLFRGSAVPDAMDPLCQLVYDTLMSIKDTDDKTFYMNQVINLSQHMKRI